MKLIISVTMLFAFATAELLPSNSYLPPPPSPRGNGYSQREQDFNAVPEIIATRNLEVNSVHDSSQLHSASTTFGGNNVHDSQSTHDALDKVRKNGFTRTALHNYGNNGILNSNHNQGEHGYNRNSDNLGNEKHSLEDANEPVNYNFGYMVNDYQEGTDFGHHEERQEERAQGEYHVVLPDGRKQTVSYQADERGFKSKISYENTDDIARSGYDSNANSLNGNGYHGNGNSDDTGHHGNGNNGGFGHHGNGNNGGVGHDGNGNNGDVDHHGNGNNDGIGHHSNGDYSNARSNGY